MNQSVTPYHHGDLRNCAIIAAAELIESIGSYDITIAQVARRVGVSSRAYAHSSRYLRDGDVVAANALDEFSSCDDGAVA